MFILQPVLDLVHFLRTTVLYIYTASLHSGRGVFLLISFIFQTAKNVYKGIVIFVEELLRFFTDLNKSIDSAAGSIRTSASNGVDAGIEALSSFAGGFQNFFRSAELLAGKFGIGIKNVGCLIYGALILIADILWWLVTLVPRTVISLVIFIIDVVIFAIAGITKGILYTAHSLTNDIFRISISIFFIVLIWKRRRPLSYLLRRLFHKVKMLLRTRGQIILTRWRNYNRPRFGNLSAVPMGRLKINRSGQSHGSSSSSFQPICVICRENPKNVLLWPCRHMCLCEECADRITQNDTRPISCPLCRSQVEYVVPIYT